MRIIAGNFRGRLLETVQDLSVRPTTDRTKQTIFDILTNRVVFDDLEESSAKMLLRDLKAAVIMPLKVKSTYHGFLLLSDKASGEIYSPQDINILEILLL